MTHDAVVPDVRAEASAVPILGCQLEEGGARLHALEAHDLAGVLLRDGDVAGAARAYAQAAAGGVAEAAFNLGSLLADQGELAAAVDAFRRADELGHGAGAPNLGALHGRRQLALDGQ